MAPNPPATFDDVASRYESHAHAQKDAGERLLGMLALRGTEDVLDVGCGTGHMAALLRGRTTGAIVGIDPSPEMIAVARGRGLAGVTFEVLAAERVEVAAAFDAVTCNSALQWFRDPEDALRRMWRALRPGGRLALQAPATARYVPAFVDAMAEVARHPDTSAVFAGWRSPWIFLGTAEEYAALAERAGFHVRHAAIEPQILRTDAAGIMTVFESAASAGYFGAAHHPAPLDPAWLARAKRIVADHFAKLAAGRSDFELVLNRVWILADR
jgi:ubiquinone/menaquinone biosynthesis C-methylase UbiE